LEFFLGTSKWTPCIIYLAATLLKPNKTDQGTTSCCNLLPALDVITKKKKTHLNDFDRGSRFSIDVGKDIDVAEIQRPQWFAEMECWKETPFGISDCSVFD
jgi:hypothetical protein